MKKYTIHIGLCYLLLLFASCDDYLDVEPESTLAIDNFYSNTVEAEIALSGIYSVFASNEVYGSAMSIIMDSGTDEGYYNRRFNENWTVGLYRHTTADDFVNDLWSSLYTAINLCNLFEEQLQRDSFEEGEYNRLLSEALFLRAHAYSLLVTWYEEVPMPLTSTKDQSANSLAPSSLEELYAQIIEDFTFASEHLASVDDPNYIQGRASKMAAHGLMARVYLKMAGYPLKDTSKYALAKEQCAIIIASGQYGLNPSSSSIVTDPISGEEKIVVTTDGYRNHFLSYIQGSYDLRESIFEVSFRYLRDSGLIVDGRIGETNGIPYGFGGGTLGFPTAFGGFSTTAILRDSYLANNDSIRRVWNIPGYDYSGSGDIRSVTSALSRSFVPGKYRRWEPLDFADVDPSVQPAPGSQEPTVILENGTIARNFTNINFPVLRYADILLMFAEADNAISGSPSTLAIQYLDEVRSRAGLASITTAKPSIINDGQAFFNEIVDERLRELCFEGLRKHDLIRWELLDDKLALLNATIQGDPDFSATNADHQAYLRPGLFFDPAIHLSLPYPLQEVIINDKLDQKDNW
ncbi:RagB/SusD family nutrient uptake outer membrane protein [Aquimarina algiphila]|uniref:RagB/SusD family nutrient uptake outer membrane protein n=1 Tax=Aquimarina algiphila TaxID=2047982 RepID=UPI002490DB0D|nr:RagB/SusD family nutrient uptake outer membrane protein [Aquimarina algiphila]